MSKKGSTTGVWFRKGLRLHDNLPLLAACKESSFVVPFFILDPSFDRASVGVQRYAFMLECLRDLDEQLIKRYKSRLLVIRGTPKTVLEQMMSGKFPVPGAKLKLDKLFFEFDSEPYALKRDAEVQKIAAKHSVDCRAFEGHTILDLKNVNEQIVAGTMKRPTDMRGIQKIVLHETKSVALHGLKVPAPKEAPSKIPPLPSKGLNGKFTVPDISELYNSKDDRETLKNFGAMRAAQFLGGESEALTRMKKEVSSKVDYVCKFEKPKTSSTNGGDPAVRSKKIDWTKPSTTGLSPYLKFGCLSVRKLWHAIDACYRKKKHAQPPMSLHGQLLFREMFYVLSYTVKNWDNADKNIMCKPVQWDAKNNKLMEAWKHGKTGYPYIDALMRQLNQTGWMHHLGRHAVSCFLTRGDLYQHWHLGRDVFDKLLLDADWALNNGNWLWLAGVAPFSMPFFRVYSPAPNKDSALNAEQTGEFIKFFVPELAKMPTNYIYKPSEAPLDVQKAANCIIGKDYPKPIVDHSSASKKNINKFGKSLSALRKRKDSGASSAGSAKKRKV